MSGQKQTASSKRRMGLILALLGVGLTEVLYGCGGDSVVESFIKTHVGETSENQLWGLSEEGYTSNYRRAMTWRLIEQRPNLVLVGSDGITNAYAGDTTVDTLLPMLCLRQDGRPVPSGLTVDFNNGWAAGEVKLTPPLAGSALSSRATADSLCASHFGAGFRMGEFHDGQGGWNWWANGVVAANTRFWVAINDQPANPWNSSGTIPPPAPPPSTLPAAYCYTASGTAVDCVSGCGAVTCRDINKVTVSCADSANAAQNCAPARCYNASGAEVNCATECDIARCVAADGSVLPCPTEYAYCEEGPTLCTTASGNWDQEDDCNTPESDTYTCTDNGTTCAETIDDSGDQDDSQNTVEPLVPTEALSAAQADLPSVESNSSCACSSGNGRTTDCLYELRLVSFKPTSAPALDRRMEVVDITADAGSGRVSLAGKYIAPDRLPIGFEVGINKTFGTVPVPCGTTKNVSVTVAATEEDAWGPDEKGSVTYTLPLSCPGGAPVRQTQKMQFKNKRGRVKHEADFTVEARVANRCAASSDLGTAPVCTPPAGTPPVPCKYEMFLESVTHRDSPTFDRKGNFYGKVSPPDFPVMQLPYPGLGKSGTLGITKGDTKDLRPWYAGAFATYNVPYGSTVSKSIPIWFEEYDNFFGIGRDDRGSANLNVNLACPPTQDTFFNTTEVKLFGSNTSKPKHVLDLSTRTTVANLNYGRVEPLEGAVTPCQVTVKVLRARYVSGSAGNYRLNFRMGGKEAWMSLFVSRGSPTWDPATSSPPRNSTIATVPVPCAQRVETTLTINGEESDTFSATEYAYADVPLSLACANAAQAETLKTVRLDFKNRRGSVRDSLDVELSIKRTETLPACQCNDSGNELGRISTWWGKVNLHKSPGGNWLTDSDCSTGARVFDLNYCRKFWPQATSVTEVPVTPKPANVWRTSGCGMVESDFDGEKEYVCR